MNVDQTIDFWKGVHRREREAIPTINGVPVLDPCFCPNTLPINGIRYLEFVTMINKKFKELCRNRPVQNTRFICYCDNCDFKIWRKSVTYYMYKRIKTHGYMNKDHCIRFNMEGDIPA